MLMWTIHDYLAYGLVDGCVHQGYKAYPICRPNLTSHHSLELGKIVYEGCREVTHLKKNQNPNHISGKEEFRNGPQPVTMSDILKSATEYGDWLQAGNMPSSRGDLSKVISIRR